ncbi:hypothetical protein C8F01DRAFT_1163741 [Mycena amicta]|nr:hypothetical protein C8F01DRAFT_1163741 [Mycena amicta]
MSLTRCPTRLRAIVPHQRPRLLHVDVQVWILYSVREVIRKAYGNYDVDVFGSVRSGLAFPTSDVDMVILVRQLILPALTGFAPDTDPKLPRAFVTRTLRKANFTVTKIVPQATVPIVTFRHRHLSQSVDLNVNDRLGVANSDLIKRYCELNPSLASHPPTFSSFALAMMSITFMQSRNLLPNLQEGLSPLDPENSEGTYWRRLRDRSVECATGWKPSEEPPVPQLVRDWLIFWGEQFDYDEQMASVRQGRFVTRPPDFHPHSALCVADPFILTKNLTVQLSHETLKQFKVVCSLYAKRPEFEQGSLPRPLGSKKDQKPMFVAELENYTADPGNPKGGLPTALLLLNYKSLQDSSVPLARAAVN